MTHQRFSVLLLVVLLGCSWLHAAVPAGPQAALRTRADQLRSKGNVKEAYDLYAKLALDKMDGETQVGGDLEKAVNCLQRLGRLDEIDAFREKVIAAHAGNWRLLLAVAWSYAYGPHYGYLVAGTFSRGYHRGGGRQVNAEERDRDRALQLMAQAMAPDGGAPRTIPSIDFYEALAGILLGARGWDDSWRLQYLTDLAALPDYEEGYGYGYWDAPRRGAPVNEDGTPVYYTTPSSWEAAMNDGERWRWALAQAVKQSPSREAEMRYRFAAFLESQFDVQTMASFGWFWQDSGDDRPQTGPYAVQTLGENETIARLAGGIQRFPLPDEFNFIRIFKEISADTRSSYSDSALLALARLFLNRRQYDRAAEYYRRSIKLHGDNKWKTKQHQLNQITGNWGQLEPVLTQPAGQGARIDFRFRNGKQVRLEAWAVNTEKLLADVKAYIASNPKHLDWERMDVGNLGYALVTKNQRQYLGRRVAAWDKALQPRPGHFDKRMTLATPLKQPGAYLLAATMAGGNTSRVVVWVADTAIVKKPLVRQAWYYLGDAGDGRPVPGATLDYFGYWQQWVDRRKNRAGYYRVFTKHFTAVTDAGGQARVDTKKQDPRYTWLITARKGARFAYLGFTGVWYGDYYDAQYNETKMFVITDRPVYRPGQAVKFKFWVNRAQYDREGKSEFAGRQFTVRVYNPKEEKRYEEKMTADDYGGFDGEFTLEKGATLGEYYLEAQLGNEYQSGGTFRVEEYRKPEFEVTVDAPKEPVMLGEKVTATVTARYYFGAPVTNAKVKYKVLRGSQDAGWYPADPWDWYYGPGYWWFTGNYPWYPGWGDWGCRRPAPLWWGYRQPQPEVVIEREAPIGPDGTVKVEIDTALAKSLLGDSDHRYEITAEVTDDSRRTIAGQGAVLVARKPFKVYAWVNRGFFRAGEAIRGCFSAQTLDNRPVQGTGLLRLLKIGYALKDGELQPVEKEVQRWELDTNDEGKAEQQLQAGEAGQYRLSYAVTDAAKHRIEGGYLFTIRGEGMQSGQFRFNDLELTTDRRDYRPGETAYLQVSANRADATVLLFLRPANGVYLPPRVLRLNGKSAVVPIPVTKKDMPNFFVEAVTLANGRVCSETREIVVPPEKRVLTVTVTPSKATYRPGDRAAFRVKVADFDGKPYRGDAVVSLYDRAVEYISGGSNVPDIRAFFWKWRREHRPQTESSLDRWGDNVSKPGERGMSYLGAFGASVADEYLAFDGRGGMRFAAKSVRHAYALGDAVAAMPASPSNEAAGYSMDALATNGAAFTRMSASVPVVTAPKPQRLDGGGEGEPALAQPAVRSNFADTALWVASVRTDENGEATVETTMPENLTGWKARVWAMGDGARVGEGSAEVVTSKDLIVRLQAPRFFVQGDEVVVSANVHNYLQGKKDVRAVLEVDELNGASLTSLDAKIERVAAELRATKLPGWELAKPVTVEAGGETRVDWRVRVDAPGQVVLRVKALTDEESDAMAATYPVYVHGMLKMESYSGAIRPADERARVTVRVPEARVPEQTRLEVRYSPTLAGAMVDALPYLAEYPYGCTEQTLNRFLPAVITQNVLRRMGLDLADIRDKRANLNAQEIGDDRTRAADWRRMEEPWRGARNPVFDEKAVQDMVRAGMERLASMQCEDGGWGWFSGWGEESSPHTTALVVHGLQLARENGVPAIPNALARGITWLKRYQQQQVDLIKLWEKTHEKGKAQADAMDAWVYRVLADEKVDHREMREFLYRDRNNLPVYAKALFGLALDRVGDLPKRDMLLRNVEQYLETDDENQTAWLRLPENNWWWCWYGSEYEAQAAYLQLLAAVEPKGERAARLAKYLINNRKNATYWKSTRDTALVVEALADYIKASGEDAPDMTVTVLVDGKAVKTVAIDKASLFTFDNKVVLAGDELAAGEHTVELTRTGRGPLYFNAYLTNFTLEKQIARAGLEIRVNRKYYRLVPANATVKAEGARGQVFDQRVEKYAREELHDLSTLKSGDLVEVELEIDAKNDYEYILFEDMKAAGFEPLQLQSGYTGNELGAYMELRDERVCFFVRSLARGKHSVSYRLRAEIPGAFSALPTKASAMYAPELRGNSDELKVRIED